MVADGAWGTELRARGAAPAEPVELASLDRPDLVAELAREYLAAGAQFLTTNTFGANRLRLPATARERTTVDELNRAAVALAKSAIAAAGAEAHLAGCIGPTGKVLAVRECGEQEISNCFAEQAEVLADAGVDLIVLETFSELAEAVLALRAVRRVTGLPVVACMSFDSGPQRTRTLAGAEASECAKRLGDEGADLIGANCGAGISNALPAIVSLKASASVPLWVKPSVGFPDLEEGRVVYPQTPDEFATAALPLIEAGASVIGACCGGGPRVIARLSGLLRARGVVSDRVRIRGG